MIRKLRFCTEIWQSCHWIMIHHIVLILPPYSSHWVVSAHFTIKGNKKCITCLYTDIDNLSANCTECFERNFNKLQDLRTCFCRQPEDRRLHSLPSISGKPCAKCFSQKCFSFFFTCKSDFNYKPECFLNPFSVHTKRRRFIKTW